MPREPIAIIGIGCRFPGAKNPAAFWQLLCNGIDAITEVPTSRWDNQLFYDPDPSKPGKMNTKWGGFLEQVDRFDPQFFEISPRETQTMDPQQRLLLELAWEALEDAGQVPSELAGQLVGVFIGASGLDYYELIAQNTNNYTTYTATGNRNCINANRLSYFFDFQGPSLTIDTACSSSLVAFHLACQSLERGESNLALVGGVNILTSPWMSVATSQGGFMAPDGRCKTFDAKADGYVRGEGAGLVILKPLSQALANRDRIYALIKGSAVNQDGCSNGLTAPNPLAQENLLWAAYQNADIAPAQVQYIEAHGTGTKLGDLIEMNALGAVLSHNRASDDYCTVGSVKTNIGHLEPAAGIAGLLKVALSLYYRQIPPSLHFNEPNPYIKFDQLLLRVQENLTPWPEKSIPAIAGVSSFGFGGTNSHIVMAEAPIQFKSQKSKVKSEEDCLERPLHLLTLSAKTENALEQLVKSYYHHLNNYPELLIEDICYTANVGRSHFPHRLAMLANSTKQLEAQLKATEIGEEIPGVAKGQKIGRKHLKLAFLFTGQGSQYVNMGRQLYQQAPIFRQALEQCDRILRPDLEHPLLEILYPQEAQKSSSSLLDQTAYTQPALFALEYALFKLWQSWGIKPNVVMGHSVGEYVAACIAGVFSLEDGLKLIAMRGRLMQQLPANGEMVSIMASESQVKEAIANYSSQVTIAAINGPESIVISGESEAIGTICSKLEAMGIKTKALQVSHAFHSPLMEPMLAEYETVAKEVTYSQPKIPLISNVTGQKVGLEITTAKYWVNHVREPVRFAESMKTLHEQGYEIFLEIGAKPILLGMGRQCLPDNVGVWLPSLRPNKIPLLSPLERGKPEDASLLKDEWQQMLDSLGKLYVQGAKVDWSGFEQQNNRQKISLPTYPFQRERHWIETNNNNFLNKQHFSTGKNLHPFLGERLNCAGEQQIFVSLIGENSPNYLSHHRVFNQALFPTAAYLEMALAAGNHRLKTPHLLVEDLIIQRGCILPEGGLTSVQTILTPLNSQILQFQIFSQQEQEEQEEQEWVIHATGKIRIDTETTQRKIDLDKYQSECSQTIEVKQHYQQCRQIGIDYRSSFQGIQKLWSGSSQALAQVKLPEELIGQTTDYYFHPALLDAALQVVFQALPQTDSGKTYLPVGIEEFQLYGIPGLEVWAYASVTQQLETQESLATQITIVSPEGEIIATVKGLQVKLATQEALLGKEIESITNWLYEVEWRTKGRLGKLLPPDFIPIPVEISQQLTSPVTELVTQLDNARISGIGKSLEELSVDYIVQALVSMGWPYKPTESFDTNAAVQHLGIVPSQQRLFIRLLQILAEVGILKPRQEQWEVQKTLEKVNPTQKSQNLLSQYPEEAATLELLDRCASQLSGVLTGTIDPVQLVFPEGDLTTATQLYEESTVTKVMNTIVQKSITKAIEKLPSNRGIKLLEIGAGTGGTTSSILPHLNPNQTEYVFTDIGALFTSKAQEKFGDYPFISYQTLDIEVDPTTQGFDSHQYDVIIAANVLHATTNMEQTLSHVRQLLAPGGILVLYEITTRQRWLDLVFGLLEGWWKFTDLELRPDHPLLSCSQWKKVLRKTGFPEVVTLPEIDGISEALSQHTVIVAKADETGLEQTNETSNSWLILANQEGIGQQLAKKLESKGEICTLVFTGEKYQQIAPAEFTINPKKPEDFEELVRAIAEKTQFLHGVVQCWSMEAGVGKTINSLELEYLSQLGCGTTLSLVQALLKGGLSTVPHLWLVTSGAQPLPLNHPIIPGVAQSSLWGMGKVIGLEHPELNCTCIDLDPDDTIENRADALFQEIWSEDKEDQVAMRGQSRYVPRLVSSHHRQTIIQQDATTEKPLSFQEDVSYLITGGLGGLGLLVARWMVSNGAKHLILVGRRSPDETANKKLAELEMAGAEVVVEKADVSDVESMTKVFCNIEKSNIPLAGVIHAAGMLSDGVLQNQSWSSFEKVMAPKVQGAWNLHQLTQDQSLEFFVLFSSAASLLGSPGQGNHSTANAFLDGLAHYRRAQGLPGLSINWGAVAQIGEAAERGADARAYKQGMGSISPNQVLESLELLMSGSDVEVGVVPIEWLAWQDKVEQWQFLADWREIIQTSSEISKSEFLLKLKETELSRRTSLLMDHIRRQLAIVLGINNPESISLETGFFDLGMDSLTSVEFRNKLQASLECSLPSTLAFEYPDIQSLTDYLEEKIIQSLDDTKSESETVDEDSFELEESESLLYEINQLSEDEIDIALDEAITKLDELL
ncbi:MAG: SDR family NAD(P)-dependent oxidoreductase [Okeania sp. SIO3B5]|uniref:type I polyketide synthase n=1 Tax=Okeania sp. SIO3B5 TaxID=2607811 RepID=UPI0014007DEE|nr:type I polyketide synthase [Okeania sp. SIO3B5]NEO53120.1 SDR family NAD(P)-dependent oxidoreductase [Okeania sp. SIO3B5]